MTLINSTLKRVFIIFNIFFAIIGGIIIALALLSQILTSIGGQNVEGRTIGIIALYIFGGVTMVISILGAYGAHKESRAALIVFLVCMVIGTLGMLRGGFTAAIIRPTLPDTLEMKFKALLPLDEAAYDVKDMADKLQSQLHCCGLFSYTDWRSNIPNSCLCDDELYQCQKVRYGEMMLSASVYTKTCYPIIQYVILLVTDISLAVFLTLGVLALLGMILSSLMIHQMRRPAPPVVLSVPAIFTPSPPKYQELHNPPGY
ncbi:23 kDa integral membrane protein-like [Gouania willdenowi]|nr:23 kDa integral membrane protein-like [Gouania willdenowi]